MSDTKEEQVTEQVDVEEKQETVEAPQFTKENPLVINRIAKNSKGGIDYVLSLGADQTYILLNFAIMFLVSQGLAVFENLADQTEEPQEEGIQLGPQLH